MREEVAKVWGEDQFKYMDYIIDHESDYDLRAQNPHSSACGLGQFIPCNKYGDIHKNQPAEKQAQEVVRYIKERANYGTPFKAYQFKIANGWY